MVVTRIAREFWLSVSSNPKELNIWFAEQDNPQPTPEYQFVCQLMVCLWIAVIVFIWS